MSRQIHVGPVAVGGGAPVSVQSMTTTRTSDIGATLQQIAELTASGCQIVRVACPTQDDADALATIASKSQIPVIADIHFQPKYVFAAIEAGCAAVRVNPGQHQAVRRQGEGDRAGRQGPRHPDPHRCERGLAGRRLLQKYGRATPEALVESALWEASLFEEHGFRDIKISVKHNDPVVMVNAYRSSPAASATTRCTSASPRPARPSRAPSSRLSPSGRCSVRDRRHDPRLAVARRPSRRSRSASRSWSRSTSGAAAGDRVVSVLRAGPGRRLQAGRRGLGGPGRAWRCHFGSLSWAVW